MNTVLPTTIPAYLAQLRKSLEGADAAMIHDALYDAEEYLRAELAANPGKTEAEVIADVASSYGAPDEVADIYRDTEVKVQTALRPPRAVQKKDNGPSVWQKIFGVFVDSRTYGALFYMLLSIATGIFYFTWTVTGASLSLGLSILIIGLPFVVLFVGATRVLALVEGRLVEVMLGERMPRRPLYSDVEQPLLKRIGAMFTDARTWGTFLYFLLMLPLGLAYFTIAVTGLSTALALMFSPLISLVSDNVVIVSIGGEDVVSNQPWLIPIVILAGFVVLLLTMHVARWAGRLHGLIAKNLLVKN
ncbi:sensor domain-containing protein [Solilutibacter tolerans]|uniref:Sensor protein n=1 Tax=Solilutibacter tolerans TaxID=1604334 RepID=A0A1N6P8Y9_9GAMM|nr:sensor domain-containing protein [Lysobacter tolerans]SIQ00753.1 sensor protein [Lysobacter tolerans]